MGRKRKTGPTIDDVLARPWCYYCERDFDDQKVLTEHQKAKHFKCSSCNKRLHTAHGLEVHCKQVHKEELTKVHNALPNREGLKPEIFGMEGIPVELLEAHRQRVTQEYFRREDLHRAKTGNPLPGSAPAAEPVAKKQKLETPEELKARLAEFRAKKRAAKEAGVEFKNEPGAVVKTEPGVEIKKEDLDGDTKMSDVASTNMPLYPGLARQDVAPMMGSMPQYQVPTSAFSLNSMYGTTMPYSGPPGPNVPYAPSPGISAGQYGSPSPLFGMPGAPPPHVPQPTYPYGPPTLFNHPSFNNASPPPHMPVPGRMPNQPPQNFGQSKTNASSPPPPQGSAPPRTNSLPAVPGLPTRLNMDLPEIPKHTLAAFHQGPLPGTSAGQFIKYEPRKDGYNNANGVVEVHAQGHSDPIPTSEDIDQLINSVKPRDQIDDIIERATRGSFAPVQGNGSVNLRTEEPVPPPRQPDPYQRAREEYEKYGTPAPMEYPRPGPSPTPTKPKRETAEMHRHRLEARNMFLEKAAAKGTVYKYYDTVFTPEEKMLAKRGCFWVDLVGDPGLALAD